MTRDFLDAYTKDPEPLAKEPAETIELGFNGLVAQAAFGTLYALRRGRRALA